MEKTTAGMVLDRLHVVFDVKNDSQLSDLIGIARATVGNWRSRNSVPYPFCVETADAKGISLDWLLMGEGPMLRTTGGLGDPVLNQEEKAFLASLNDLDDAGRRAVLDYTQERRANLLIRKRLDELEKKLVISGAKTE